MDLHLVALKRIHSCVGLSFFDRFLERNSDCLKSSFPAMFGFPSHSSSVLTTVCLFLPLIPLLRCGSTSCRSGVRTAVTCCQPQRSVGSVSVFCSDSVNSLLLPCSLPSLEDYKLITAQSSVKSIHTEAQFCPFPDTVASISSYKQDFAQFVCPCICQCIRNTSKQW